MQPLSASESALFTVQPLLTAASGAPALVLVLNPFSSTHLQQQQENVETAATS